MNNFDPYSINNILNYLRDKLSKRERYDLDREISKDPFLEDAMDGFAQLAPEEMEHDLLKLDSRINNLITKKKKRTLIPFLRIAAGIVIIVGIGSLVIFKSIHNITHKEMAKNNSPKEIIDSLPDNYIPQNKARAILDKFEEQQEKDQLAHVLSEKTKIKEESIIKSEEKNQAKTAGKMSEITLFADEDSELVAGLEIQEDIALLDKQIVTFEKETEDDNAKLKEPATDPSVMLQPITKASKLTKNLTVTIQGSVIDIDTKEPIIGATITQNEEGAISDIDGNFNFEIKDDSVIQIAFIGYKTQKITTTELLEKKNTIELQADQIALQEVVIRGVASHQKMEATSAISRIEPNKQPPENLSYTIRTKNARINYNSGFEKHAEPEGGIDEFGKYIELNSKLSPEKNMKVILEFYVTSNGTIGNIRIVKSDGKECENEAIRLIKEGPAWTPAENNGSLIRELVNLKIVFKN
ncbi:MAG: carboxypeptidase-like regulatory domain-containing protein [Salinivirgaceae bacterium]|jgi:hypothetical protein|nr:carboxypeptidase-like regulatory domain-containing protein [Salinivirgaceae bacterium]